jgi:hypothetical protein
MDEDGVEGVGVTERLVQGEPARQILRRDARRESHGICWALDGIECGMGRQSAWGTPSRLSLDLKPLCVYVCVDGGTANSDPLPSDRGGPIKIDDFTHLVLSRSSAVEGISCQRCHRKRNGDLVRTTQSPEGKRPLTEW